MKRKTNRGGARPGAGRPYVGAPRTTVAVRMSQDEVDKLDAMRGDRTRSDEVRRLIRNTTPPQP